MKIAGIIFLIIGIVATLIFGIQALGESETFSLFGLEIAVSSANWTPVIISVAVLIIGIIMTRSASKT